METNFFHILKFNFPNCTNDLGWKNDKKVVGLDEQQLFS